MTDDWKLPSDFKWGELLNCRVEIKGRQFFGCILVSSKKIEARLAAYGETVSWPENFDVPLHFWTEDNWRITLVDPYVISDSSHGLVQEQQTSKLILSSGSAVVGRIDWPEDGRVKQLYFSIPKAWHLLSSASCLNGLHEDNYYLKDTKLFSLNVANNEVNLFFSASSNTSRPRQIGFLPRIGVTFGNDWPLNDIYPFILSVCEFFSALMGERVYFANIEVLENSSSHYLETGDFANLIFYKVQIHDPKADESVSQRRPLGSLIVPHCEEEENCLRDAFQCWLARDAAWASADLLMMATLSENEQFSANRLLLACRWFEEMPVTTSQEVIPKSEVRRIKEAVKRTVDDLGGDAMWSRMADSMKRIGRESRPEIIERLVKTLSGRFGDSVLKPDFISDLKRAFWFRGKCAHGAFHPETDEQLHQFVDATLALEALCFLLTIKELPLTKNGMTRLNMHRFIDRYRRMKGTLLFS